MLAGAAKKNRRKKMRNRGGNDDGPNSSSAASQAAGTTRSGRSNPPSDSDANNDINNKRKRPPVRKRSSHLLDTTAKEKLIEKDTALKKELERLEASDSHWNHPVGFNLLAALRILNAAGDPVFRNTGHWIQPEDVEDIPAMFESYLNVNCLYYSLVGVMAIETSLWLPIPDPDTPEYAQWFITISRFCWCANGVWSMAAVVASFHILWCIYATPTWARRRFIFENSKTLSAVYSLGAPNFALMMIGTITSVIGVIANKEGYTKREVISAGLGLGVGASVSFVFVLCSGSLISKVLRPWKLADSNLREKKCDWSESGRSIDTFYDNYQPNDDPNGDFQIHDADEAGFESLGMPFVSRKLCSAGLTLDMLQRVNNEILLDQLLQGAGVSKAGDRLKVIFFVRGAATLDAVKM